MLEPFSIAELYPLMRETLDAGKKFRFYPNGTSMLPMLHPGEDSVVLTAVDPQKVRIGDVLFYQRDDGQFVLHRLVAFESGKLNMCGDNHRGVEFGIRRDQILARLDGYYTGETYKSLDSKEYRAYKRERVRRLFLRKNSKVYSAACKLKRLLIKLMNKKKR